MASRPVRRPAPAVSHRQVLVGGDVILDWNLAHTQDRTEMYCSPGGAAAMTRLLGDVFSALADDGLEVEVVGPTVATASVSPLDPCFHHRYTLWSEYPSRLGDRSGRAWRVDRSLGLDRARSQSPEAAGGPSSADLVVVDDANLGFRDTPALWPSALGGTSGPQPWIIVNMASPVASGPFWHRLLESASERLFVVMTLDDLQLSDVKISRELSWERTAGDIVRELVRHPAVNSLARCAHVLVSLQTTGGVLLSRRAGPRSQLDRLDCHVFFDSDSMGSSWTDQHPGGMVGYPMCLVAGAARELLLEPEQPDVHRGVRRGLSAERALHLVGYGDTGNCPERAALDFPSAAIAKHLQTGATDFQVAAVDHPVRESWSILEARYPEGLEPVAEAIALRGLEGALADVPLGRFDKLETVDRGEIEGFRSIGALIREYDAEPSARPLNIAVFGPPGAGKSFGVKAVAKSVVGGRVETMTFNLSQMKNPSELLDALHEVRDAGLEGHLPFVLWDEFDSDLEGRPFAWLRHFLAPMQDGAFQQGQVLHPIGKAIFVFAGGTCSRLADFVADTSDQFRLAKGPDFVSRLKGHVDIVGPDPRSADSDRDPHFRIRRAILLRSMLLRDRPNLFIRDGRATVLDIDPGVLRGFLEVSSYRHGARSMETIVAMSTLHGMTRYERSALPAADQLDAHVNASEFLELVQRYVPDGELLERLSEGVHVSYCEKMLGRGHEWTGDERYLTERDRLSRFVGRKPNKAALPALVPWPELSADLKEMNRAAARDLPHKLAELGYVLCEQKQSWEAPTRFTTDDPNVERLSRLEHERWMVQKVKQGWQYGEQRDDTKRIHPSLRPWADLTKEERDKDLQLVLDIPVIVDAAGMSMAQVDELSTEPVAITVSAARAEAS